MGLMTISWRPSNSSTARPMGPVPVRTMTTGLPISTRPEPFRYINCCQGLDVDRFVADVQHGALTHLLQ